MFVNRAKARSLNPTRSHLEPLEDRTLCSVTLPDKSGIATPPGNPKLPAAFDVFMPPVSAIRINSKAPTLATWTSSGDRNDPIALAGKLLSAQSNFADTKFYTYGQTNSSNGVLASDSVQTNDGTKASATLSSANTPNSFYLLWAKNVNGYSSPVAINKAQAWWVGPGTTSAGATVSVYGQDLSRDGGTSQSWVYVNKVGSSTGQWAQVSSVNPYQVQFTVPGNLANGNYQVWVHNGGGGKYGWSSPVTMTVANAVQYAGPAFNVKNFGAVGDGIADDTTAINNTLIAAMMDHNATVYLPAGTYLISRQLSFGEADRSPMQLIGDGSGSTIIKCSSTFDSSSYTMLSPWSPNVRIANLALDTNSAPALNAAIDTRGNNGLQLSGIAVNAHQTHYLFLNGDSNVSIANSSFIGDGGFLGNASQVFINGCSFYGTNDANSLLTSWGGQQISITHCTASDYDNSDLNSGAGWGEGRFFVCNSRWGSESNIYIGDNTTTALGVRPTLADQNQGEQILFEGQDVDQFASAKFISATATTVRMSGLPSGFSPVGLSLVIVDGTGVGQTRAITSYNSITGKLTISSPWGVNPDSLSVIRVGKIVSQVAIYGNNLNGKGPTQTASSGVSLYGGCFNTFVDSNIISAVNGGMSIFALKQTNEVQPSDFNLIQNNTVSDSAFGILLYGVSVSGQTGLIGNILRGNTLNNLNSHGIQLTAEDTGIDLDTNVISNNSTTNTPTAIAQVLSGTSSGCI